MQTQSNPQQPATTATPAGSPELATTAGNAASRATTAEQKPTAPKKPAAKQPTRQHVATQATAAKKPAAKGRQAEKTVATAERTKPAPTTSATGPREGSTMWAILQILSDATEPLSAKEIYKQIAERKLASGLKGKTPHQTVAATLAVSAKKRQYIERAAPGKFQILKERP